MPTILKKKNKKFSSTKKLLEPDIQTSENCHVPEKSHLYGIRRYGVLILNYADPTKLQSGEK